jgi:replication factor A1
MVNDEKMYYLSCPDCRKKVIDEGTGWRCENCNKVQATNIPTYMLSAKISDPSGSVFVSFPRELGDSIMNGMTATEFKDFKEDKSMDEFKEFLNTCCFRVIIITFNLFIVSHNIVEGYK